MTSSDAAAGNKSPSPGLGDWRDRLSRQAPLTADELEQRRLEREHELQEHLRAVAERDRLRMPPIIATAPDSLSEWLLPESGTGTGPDGRPWRSIARELRAHAGEIAADWKGAQRKKYPPWLVLLGTPGAGKTLLAQILAKHARTASRLSVGWAYAPDLYGELKATRSPRSGRHFEDVLEQVVARPDLLVLDDLRPNFGTQDDENILDRIIKERHGLDLGRRGRLLIITANLNVPELKDLVGMAAWDRIEQHGRPWLCTWPSRRTTIQEER